MSEKKGKKKALIISVSNYKNKNLDNLEFCKNDGEEIYRILKKLGYEISSSHKLIGNVESKYMKTAIIDFFRKHAEQTDTLLFYFSGHGYTDGYGDGFFCTSSIDLDIPDYEGIKFNLLTEQMDKCNSQRIVAILDCCHSGTTISTLKGRTMGTNEKEDEAERQGSAAINKEFRQGQGRCILASSLSNRKSYALADESFSAFTKYVIEGLKGETEAVDEQGYVTPEKLSMYVSRKLEKLQGKHFQKPLRNLAIEGTIILAEYPELVSKTIVNEQQMQIELEDEILSRMSVEKLEKWAKVIEKTISKKTQKKEFTKIEEKLFDTKKKLETDENDIKQISEDIIKIEEKFITIGEHKIRYLESGNSEEYLILLHGLGYSADQWRKIMPYLNKKYHIIAPDIIGFGHSDKPLIDYNLEAFREFLSDLIEVLEIKHTVVIGSDLGGMIAAECAIKQMKSIQKIILVSPSGTMKNSTPALDAYIMSALYPNEKSATDAFKMMANSDKNVDTKETSNFVKRMQLPNAKLAFMSTVLGIKKNAVPLVNNSSKILIPTMIVWGSQNIVNPIDNANELVASIQNCRFTIMNNCTNNPFVEEPKKFSDNILDFLE